jgi:hypothetical protein
MSGVVRAACLVPAVLAAHAGSVEGHGSWKGKTLTFRYVYLVTYGSKAYVLLSAADVGEAIRGCPRLECAVWDVLRDAVVIEPEENGHFWLRAVHPDVPGERQISYRGFEETARKPGRLAGRLEYALENHLSYRRAPPGVGYRWPSASVAYDRGFEHGGRHAYCWWPASGGRLDAPLVKRFGDPR